MAKSIIMIAFFFTMPMSRMIPMSAMTLNSVSKTQERQQRADAGGRQGREDGDGVDQALVEDPEDDVDGEERRQDEDAAWIASDCWKAWAVPWNEARMDAGTPISDSALRMASMAWPERHAGCEVEREGDGRELPLVAHREQRPVLAVARDGGEGDLGARLGLHVHAVERLRLGLQIPASPRGPRGTGSAG